MLPSTGALRLYASTHAAIGIGCWLLVWSSLLRVETCSNARPAAAVAECLRCPHAQAVCRARSRSGEASRGAEVSPRAMAAPRRLKRAFRAARARRKPSRTLALLHSSASCVLLAATLGLVRPQARPRVAPPEQPWLADTGLYIVNIATVMACTCLHAAAGVTAAALKDLVSSAAPAPGHICESVCTCTMACGGS